MNPNGSKVKLLWFYLLFTHIHDTFIICRPREQLVFYSLELHFIWSEDCSFIAFDEIEVLTNKKKSILYHNNKV